MNNSFLVTLCTHLTQFNIIFSSLIILLSGIIFYFYDINSKQFLIKDFGVLNIIKFLLVLQLSVFLVLNLVTFYIYIIFLKSSQMNLLFSFDYTNLYTQYAIPINLFSFKLTLDLLGLVFSNLAFFVGLISLLALDTRFYWNNVKFYFVCNIIVLSIFMFTLTNNFFIFFLMYELLLIPSFLFVYFISPGKQSIQASLYFVIWTQIGSFLVLIAVAYLTYIVGGTSFYLLRSANFTNTELQILLFLFFFGFGFKVPIWPFHYWITKTHVEAPTGFSIFLSGFLVKSAIYGFYKYTTLLGGSIDTVIFSTFAMMGIIDASIKMWGQTDLKKLVAYATIQEMGLIYLVFCWGDVLFLYGGVLFCITHAFLSSLFFFFVDCVNRRFNSRNIVEVNGILHINPNLGTAILFGCVLYSGLPGTLKFISEFYIFSGLLEVAPISAIIIIFTANFLGILGFSKVWFNAVFGMNPIKTTFTPKDLSFKELFIIGFCMVGLMLYGIWLPAIY